MKTLRAWILLVMVLLVGLVPIAASADDRGAVQQTVDDNWVEGVPTPWFCLWPPLSGICVPPW